MFSRCLYCVFIMFSRCLYCVFIMFSRRLHNVFAMPLLRVQDVFIIVLYCFDYAFIMPTLRFYYIILNNINIYIALSLESSRCGALWNRCDVVLFWNCLYRALSLESSQ